ncbi:MAG: MerR family transcriptional regulator [Spirochaetales bacterium]|uniref:MerR family transcriptional regulator n=1 Tax=Candidatus Thalassospirochaeta sargassi TaxID=3119039 RepID=A0AAJ1MIW6_9SPIO|nr:MerR family transcriptional regulator [Spirochaetales bacterium]
MEYLTIGEICRLLEVKPHVLRYWEQEFEIVNPRKDRNGKRQYSRNDINILFRIKHLLHDEKFTIEGAKQKIWAELSQDNVDVKASVHALRETLVKLSIKIDEMKNK